MNILQVYWKFEHFGNEGWIPNSPGSYDSLESIHDQIHGLVGNGGHMGIVRFWPSVGKAYNSCLTFPD